MVSRGSQANGETIEFTPDPSAPRLVTSDQQTAADISKQKFCSCQLDLLTSLGEMVQG
ncbi:hypothetical protein FRB94_002860, partial [Tulasnella sp. JGI-2019a]